MEGDGQEWTRTKGGGGGPHRTKAYELASKTDTRCGPDPHSDTAIRLAVACTARGISTCAQAVVERSGPGARRGSATSTATAITKLEHNHSHSHSPHVQAQ